MNDYILYTDSACDIAPSILKEWDVSVCPLTFTFEGDETKTIYHDGQMDMKDFYDKMRKGGIAKTAAVNSETFAIAFEEILKTGKDILYLAFSSGLSNTYNAGRIAAEEVSSKYPDHKIIVVDSLAASAGFGLLLYLLVQKKKKGATLEEAARYAEDTRLHICHWFTVDDLVYLKRGGRISPTAAFVGNALGIKPVLHVDNDGHLINMFKVRGRKTSVSAMADKYGELAVDPKGGTVFISHGDCMKDVDELKSMLETRYKAKVQLVTSVGCVIGAHSGPGTLALFFVGKER